MRPAIRAASLALAQLLLVNPIAALAAPFYSAGVSGVADANDSARPCALPGGYGEGYRTYPLGAFLASAAGKATAFNPCSPLGLPLAISSANLASGDLRVSALAEVGQNMFTQKASAFAYFSDDVTLMFGGTPVNVLANGLVGEIRLDIHGTRSVSLTAARASLQVDALDGREIGVVDIDDLHGGESLVVNFNTPFHFFASLDVTARNGEFANFGNTGRISVILPEGYSFGSSSGVLLTVPEPAGFATLAMGLGALAVFRTRRHA